MTFAEGRAYLRGLEHFGVKLGLDNIRVLLAALGDPQTAVPAVHVAGTNGKGSVCAFLASILEAHGLRVGLYTSPHLVSIRERIRVGGRLIGAREFARHLGRIRETIDALLKDGRLGAHPTFFEVVTALAFLHFAKTRPDIVILEVGLGGRFDATNVVRPLVSVITSIGLDHQEHLGATLPKIAFEKAGIIKPGTPVVCGAGRPAAEAVIRARAAECGSPFILAPLGRDELTAAWKNEAYLVRCRFEGQTYAFFPGLQGRHQASNAAIALAAAVVLGRLWRPLDKRRILRGLETARWEGRLEAVGRRPLVLLDGAHNEDGARALAAYMADIPRGPLVLVFAMMRDKAVRRAAALLFRRPKRVLLTSMPYARAARPEEVLAQAPSFRSKIEIEADFDKALARARAQAGPRGTVLVAGSLYLVGEAKKRLAAEAKRRSRTSAART